MFISPARCANCDSFITASQRCATWGLSPGSPPCLDAPAGHSSAFVTLDCVSVVWQSLLTFGTPAPSSSTQDSALSPPPRWVPAQIIEQQSCYSKTQLQSTWKSIFFFLSVYCAKCCIVKSQVMCGSFYVVQVHCCWSATLVQTSTSTVLAKSLHDIT